MKDTNGWRPVEAVRQTRPDHLVEVRVAGRWVEAWRLQWQRPTVLPAPARVGELVRMLD